MHEDCSDSGCIPTRQTTNDELARHRYHATTTDGQLYINICQSPFSAASSSSSQPVRRRRAMKCYSFNQYKSVHRSTFLLICLIIIPLSIININTVVVAQELTNTPSLSLSPSISHSPALSMSSSLPVSASSSSGSPSLTQSHRHQHRMVQRGYRILQIETFVEHRLR